MSVTLTLLLATPLFTSCGPVLTFQDMLDSAQIVVIGKVDSMWYSGETRPWTNVSAGILTLYVKSDSIPLLSSPIHIVYTGGVLPSGIALLIPGSVSFEENESFLAAVRKYPQWNPENEDVYVVTMPEWKYTIANDSLYLRGNEALPLAQVLQALSSHFIKKEAE